jgi:hypothetical protein
MNTGGVSLELKRDRKGCRLDPHLELKVRLRVSISNVAQTVLTTSSCRMYHYHSERYSRVSVSPSKGHETLHYSRLKLIVRLSCQGLLGPICRRSTLLQGCCSESFEAYCSTYPSLPRNVCVSCINSDQSTARPKLCPPIEVLVEARRASVSDAIPSRPSITQRLKGYQYR